MSYIPYRIVACCLVFTGLLAAAGCEPKRLPAMTVTDLMEDRITLDGVLMKCNQDPARAGRDADCRNARIAIERLAQDVDPAEVAKRNAEFERSREQLRRAQERAREDREARDRVDPYNLPVVPVESGQPGVGPSS